MTYLPMLGIKAKNNLQLDEKPQGEKLKLKTTHNNHKKPQCRK